MRARIGAGMVVCALIAPGAGCAWRGAPPPSPVQSAAPAGSTLEQRQQRTGAAYRDMQQARHEKRLAEQDLLNAQAAYEAAQKNAAALKHELDGARKAYAAAEAREKKSAQAYEAGLKSVDEVFRNPAPR